MFKLTEFINILDFKNFMIWRSFINKNEIFSLVKDKL